MKTIMAGIVVVVLLLMAGMAVAQVNTWYEVSKGSWPTAVWDAVTLLNDGDPLPDAGDAVLTYNLYLKNVNTQAVILIGSGITATQQAVALPKRAKYLVGVEAVLLYTGETEAKTSTISWTDNSTVCQNGLTFGLRFQTGPKGPVNLKKQ